MSEQERDPAPHAVPAIEIAGPEAAAEGITGPAPHGPDDDAHRRDGYADGARAAIPILLPTFAIGVSYGVLAAPVLGPLAAIVLTVIVMAGGAQIAALSVLMGGGHAPSSIVAGLLMNVRFLPMSLALAPSMRGRTARRVAESQAIVDPSFVLADNGDGTFSRERLLGATAPQVVVWVGGSVLGVFASDLIGDPDQYGLDVIFPAFYLALLLTVTTTPLARRVAAVAAVITVVCMTFAPAGVPVVAASLAALLGLRPPAAGAAPADDEPPA